MANPRRVLDGMWCLFIAMAELHGRMGNYIAEPKVQPNIMSCR